jgi:hypothetical protein
MEPSVYNNDIISKHSLFAYCASTLNAVSERDYPGKNFFAPEIACLDIDAYEKSVCHGSADCTADAVIGISTCVNKVTCNHRLLLVELRMRYKSANTLRKGDLENKVSHTRNLLGGELTIENENVFVFTDQVAAQARHKFNSWKHEGGLVTSFKAYSVREFCNNVKSINDMPYTPKYDPIQLCKELDSFVKASEWKQLFGKLYFWLEIAENVRYSNTFEYESLQKTIKGWWQRFCMHHTTWSSEDDELDFLIVDDDIQTVLV